MTNPDGEHPVRMDADSDPAWLAQVSQVGRALTACTANGISVDGVTLVVRPEGMAIQPHDATGEDVAVAILAQLTDEPVRRIDHNSPPFSVYAAGGVEVYADLHPDARPAGGA